MKRKPEIAREKTVRKCYEGWAKWAPSRDIMPYPEMLNPLVEIFELYGHDTEAPFQKQETKP